jgi:hypothetical protein
LLVLNIPAEQVAPRKGDMMQSNMDEGALAVVPALNRFMTWMQQQKELTL